MLNLLLSWLLEIYRKIMCVYEPACVSGVVSYGALLFMYIVT
jgi:hypothetical protein